MKTHWNYTESNKPTIHIQKREPNMTKVLLTGASGYIGKHITLQLLTDGYEVNFYNITNPIADQILKTKE